jgi:hypothetical protein
MHDLPLTVVERDLGTLDQQSTVEGQGVLFNLDISTFDVGRQDTVLH